MSFNIKLKRYSFFLLLFSLVWVISIINLKLVTHKNKFDYVSIVNEASE